MDIEFKDKIQKIKIFTQQNGITPRDSDNADETEHALGRFLVKIRNAYRYKNTSNYDLSAERYSFIKYVMPNLL